MAFNMDSARWGVQNNIAVATTSTSVASAAFGTQTYQVRIVATAACYAKFGDPAATPTAATTDALIPPNWSEYVTVTPGQKVAIYSPTIQTVSITEITG